MKLTAINAKDAPQPIGGYNQAMLLKGAKRILFVSGQIPQRPNG
jgi:enamine deaminase RidA (YjgF/YER057c/UK114 family)